MKIKTTSLAQEERVKEKNSTEQSMKKKMLEVTFSQIDKQYGSGAVMKLGETLTIFDSVFHPHRMAIGLPGEPVAPFSGSGTNTKANSYTLSFASASRSRFSRW